MNSLQQDVQRVHNFSAIAQELAESFPSMEAIDDIGLGWTDTLLFDSEYINPKLKIRKPKRSQYFQQTGSSHSTELGHRSIQQLVDELPVEGPVVELAEAVLRLNQAREASLCRDDFWQTPDADLHSSLKKFFSASSFNVVIVGAGPVGALLASGLKRALGENIAILLVESRVEEEHFKKPYSRRWQMNIPLPFVSKLLMPEASLVCERTGDGSYVGVDLCSLETLALLSARAAGVYCLFSKSKPEDWLQGSNTHLVVDASGGHWRTLALGSERMYPGLTLKQAKNRCNAYVHFGLSRSKEIPNSAVDVLHKDGYLQPVYKGKPIKQALLKISEIAIEQYPFLLTWVLQNNRDSKFYLWPGRKHTDVNKLLVLVNLTSKESDALGKWMAEDTSLADLIKWQGARSSLDARLIEFINLLVANKATKKSAWVSRPFLVVPKMLDPDSKREHIEGVPVLPIGDSFFNGNPKSGNGLGVHLKHVHQIGRAIKHALG